MKRSLKSLQERKEFEEEIDASAFGTFNAWQWKTMREQTLWELQSFVAQTYQSFPPHLMTSQLSIFISSVVTPCLRVNVSQVDEGLAPIAAAFVRALENRRLNEAWLREIHLVSGCVCVFLRR